MKIVMICEFFNELLEYQENLLAKYYVKNGHEVSIITSTFDSVFDYYNDRHDKKSPPRKYEFEGIQIYKLQYQYNILNKLRAYTPIYELLESEQPDLIYVHDIIPNLPEMVRYVKRHPKCRMIMDYHADYSNSGANWLSLKILHGMIRKHWLDQARPYLRKIFPVVPVSTTFLHEVYGVPLGEMELLPLGTDLEYGARIRAEGARAEVRAALGIPDDSFAVFTGGKLTPLKKTEHLIAGLAALGRPDVHLIVVGDASEKEAAYKAMLLEAAGGMPNVHFRGWQDKYGVYRHLAAADVAVFPASQSVMWQQAIGMGLPLIVSERSHLAKGSQDVGYLNLYDNIIILDHERPLAPQIAGHLDALISDTSRRMAMADGAGRVADELLDWNKLIEKTLRFNTL